MRSRPTGMHSDVQDALGVHALLEHVDGLCEDLVGLGPFRDLHGVDQAHPALEILAKPNLLRAADRRTRRQTPTSRPISDELGSDVLHGKRSTESRQAESISEKAGSGNRCQEASSSDSRTCWTASRAKVIRVLLLSSTLRRIVSVLDLDHGADHAADGSDSIVLLHAAQKCLPLLAFLSLSKDAEENHHQDERKEHEHEQASAAIGRRPPRRLQRYRQMWQSAGMPVPIARERWPLLPESQERTVWRDRGRRS